MGQRSRRIPKEDWPLIKRRVDVEKVPLSVVARTYGAAPSSISYILKKLKEQPTVEETGHAGCPDAPATTSPPEEIRPEPPSPTEAQQYDDLYDFGLSIPELLVPTQNQPQSKSQSQLPSGPGPANKARMNSFKAILDADHHRGPDTGLPRQGLFPPSDLPSSQPPGQLSGEPSSENTHRPDGWLKESLLGSPDHTKREKLDRISVRAGQGPARVVQVVRKGRLSARTGPDSRNPGYLNLPSIDPAHQQRTHQSTDSQKAAPERRPATVQSPAQELAANVRHCSKNLVHALKSLDTASDQQALDEVAEAARELRRLAAFTEARLPALGGNVLRRIRSNNR